MEENETKESKAIREIIEWCLCIFLALIIALATRYYVIAPTIVKQTSMYPTLQENERLMISRVKRLSKNEYKRGDIITFEAPDTPTNLTELDLENPIAIYTYEPEGLMDNLVYYVLELNKKSYIKRIIGIEGDKIQIENGKVFVNGIELDENYLQNNVTTKTGIYNNITVPEGYVYVLGDNRNASMDSRILGCIPVEKIEGKVIFRYWPMTNFGKIK